MTSDPTNADMLTAVELELLRLFRDHPNENIAIVHPKIDQTTELGYITIAPDKEGYIRVPNTDILEKERALRFLESFIAVERGVKPEDVTKAYIDKILSEPPDDEEAPTNTASATRPSPKP